MKNKPISTGNDIIALDQINTCRTLQKRFYSRILSEDEISLFNQGDFRFSFESFVWLCWSIKESVFKFVKRHQHGTVFSPVKIIIAALKEPSERIEVFAKKLENIAFHDAGCICCEVLYDNQKYYTRSIISNHFIFSVANNNHCFKNTSWGIQTIENDSYDNQAQCVRTFVLETLQLRLKSTDLKIEKAAAGFPFIAQHSHIPLSFTHHGNFIGYSFVLENTTGSAHLSKEENCKLPDDVII